MKFLAGFTVGVVTATVVIFTTVGVAYASKTNKIRRSWDQLAVNDRWLDSDRYDPDYHDDGWPRWD